MITNNVNEHSFQAFCGSRVCFGSVPSFFTVQHSLERRPLPRQEGMIGKRTSQV